MYTRREDNSLEFSASIPVNACFWRGGDLGVTDYLFLLLFFFQKGRWFIYHLLPFKVGIIDKAEFLFNAAPRLNDSMLSNDW